MTPNDKNTCTTRYCVKQAVGGPRCIRHEAEFERKTMRARAEMQQIEATKPKMPRRHATKRTK